MTVEATGVREKLARTVSTLGGVLVLICSGLACERSDRPAAERAGAASTASRERPEDPRTAVWVRAIPAAFLQATAAPDARQ